MAPFTSHRHINTVEKIYVYQHVVSIKKEKKPFKVQVRTKFFFGITYSWIYMLNFGNSGNRRSLTCNARLQNYSLFNLISVNTFAKYDYG